MSQRFFAECDFGPREREVAALALSRLADALPEGVEPTEVDVWDILEAIHRMLRRVRDEWAIKILDVWANYYMWELYGLQDPDACDTSRWFTGEEIIRDYGDMGYPPDLTKLFAEFLASEYHGAETTRTSKRAMFHALIRGYEEGMRRDATFDRIVKLTKPQWNQIIEWIRSQDYGESTEEQYEALWRRFYRFLEALNLRQSVPYPGEQKQRRSRLSDKEAIRVFFIALTDTLIEELEEEWGSTQEQEELLSKDTDFQKQFIKRYLTTKLDPYEVIETFLVLWDNPPGGKKLSIADLQRISEVILGL